MVLRWIWHGSITVVWCAVHGHHPSDAAVHRARAPWYTTKTDPSLADMLAKLRRVIIAARFLPVTQAPRQTPKSRPSTMPGPKQASNTQLDHTGPARTAKVE
ncbi:hypothetical protein ACIBJF_37780 [Streptomyces sp. NPDC050743]|uniref:hypothetical protein n=1 Tax=Streptomyces sp. NPDC050743 TaxID=3365634 RepID=UPI0037A3B443